MSSRLLRVRFALLPLLLVATAHADPRKPTHVACVGDSITEGAGASNPSKNYVSQLQVLMGTGVQVKNFGRSAATALGEGAGDVPYVKQTQYTAATDFVNNAGADALVSVVIVLGANDSKPKNWEPAAGKNDQRFLADYGALVDHFAGLASKPVVYVAFPLATGNAPCCDIRGAVIHDQELPLIRQIAMTKHLPIIDLNGPTTGHPEYFGDGVHPNDAGYLVMANLVKAGLEREPTVELTSPTAGAMVAGTTALQAMVLADFVNVTKVEFFEQVQAAWASVGVATAAPYQVSWAAPAGAHTVRAVVTDATLATATSAQVAYQVTAAGGGSAGAGAGGSAGNDAGGLGGGNATGGVAGGNAGTAGSVTSLGGGGSGGAAPVLGAAGAGVGAAGAPSQPATASATDEGGCSMPRTSRTGSVVVPTLLGLGLLMRAVRRRQRG